jgi:hypothetical protein
MASLKNTGVAGRNKYKQQQQAQTGGADNEQPQPPVMPPLTNTASKNQRTQVSRNNSQQPPVQQAAPRLGDYQTTTSATDPRKIFQRLSDTQIVQDQVFASIQDVNNGQANWEDVKNEERKKILSDPNFYKNNLITKYDPAIQQQILADPNFDWSQLPNIKTPFGEFNPQQMYYTASSNPAAMGALQGAVMGAGNPGGAIVGGAIGWASSVLGYDPNKEFWEQGDKKFTWDINQASEAARGSLGLLNLAAEQAEKGIGTAAQVANYAADPNKQVADLFKDFENTWNSSANFFEVITPAINESFSAENKAKEGLLNPIFQQVLPIYVTAKIGEIILNPEKYKGAEMYLGASSAIPLDESWIQRIEGARKEIEAGRPYREVMMEIQNGVLAQIGDMAGQGLADPLNVVGKVEAKVGEVTARVSGDKIAEAAFSKAEGFYDAQNRIQNIINNPAEALKIDPNYKVSELGWISKSLSGLTKDNKVKGGLLPSSGGLLDYTPPKKNLTGFIDSLTSLTPESRARTGQDLLVRNLGSIMASYFNGNDVAGFSKWWKAFSNGDMTQSAELSRTMAQSPEFYTVLPAAKGFDIDGQLSVWETSEPARMAVSRIADVLGENPMTFIEDVARRGTEGVDFARIQEKLKATDTPEAKALLAEIEAGRFTAASLTDAVKAFADGSIPFHPGQWMAETLDAIKDHYDQWAVDHFKLDEESRKTLFRVTAIMKSAQSILLLGANPGYMISNVLPTMVTRAASGVYGYMTPTAIDTFFSRMGFALEEGFAPNRLEEGVGPGGITDQAKQTGDTIREATLGKGKLTDIQKALGRIGSAMPFNKLSRLLEGYEGKMAYAIGIKKFWGESWRRGTGFREIPKALLTELQRTVGNRAADILYAQIEAGMTKAEIFGIVEGRSAQIQSRTLINDAAQGLNIPASKAASMFEQMGIFDELDGNLKGATTQSRVDAAFNMARQTAQAAIDQQASRDAIARIEHISNRIQTEGVKAITDVVMDTEMQGIEKWLQHYERMGEAADAMDSIPNADTRNRIWGLKYAESNAEYRRYNAQRGSTYLGILKAVGLESGESGRGWLSTIADTDRVLDNAYRTTRDLRDQHFKKWNDDWDNPRRNVERSQIEAQIDKTWKDATKAEARNLKKMGELLAQQYEQLFGVEAGEAARQAWEQITEFRKEMTTRRDEFRASLEGVPSARRQQMSKDFWQNNYNYMVIEMGRIKQEAIANLDRIANNGRGSDPTGTGAGIDPNKPGGNNPEMEALRQAAQERARIQREKLDALWDIAKDYSKKQANNSSNFTRGFFGDEQHLRNTLRMEEYGGDPTITSLQDAAEKLTPEQIRDIFERREGDKAAQQAAFEAEQAQRFATEMANAEVRAKNKKVSENVQILQNIRKRGGIDIESWKKVADKPEGYQVGVFSRNGKNRWAADQMAQLLADDGYPIDVNNPADIGGVQQMIDLIQRARAGEEIYPIGHEFVIDAEVNKAQADFIEQQIAEATKEFDTAKWENDIADAIDNMDIRRASQLWDELPEEMGGEIRVNGETFAEYAARAIDEITNREQAQTETIAIVENQIRAEAAVRQQETTAETSMTRQLFYEKLQDVFNLSTDEADTVISLTDARAESWASLGNGNADDWYATRIADVVKDGGIDLAQEAYRIEPSGYGDGTYYIRGEDGRIYNSKNKKLEANPDGNIPRRFKSVEEAQAALARAGYETDAIQNRQTAKGGIQFLDDGRAIIRAFESADVYTVAHEISNVFFKDLPEAEYGNIKRWIDLIKKGDTWKTNIGNFTIRETGSEFIYKDISGAERKFATLDQARAVLEQEAFARGFEKYVADGTAPTPKMKGVFEKFKTWAAKVYGAIVGSPIDITLTSAVKDVFDRLLSNDRTDSVDVGDILMQLGYDTKTHRLNDDGRIVRRGEIDIRVDKGKSSNEASQLIDSFQKRLDDQRVRLRTPRDTAPITATAPAKDTDVWNMTYQEYKAMLLREQNTARQTNSDAISSSLYGDVRENYRKAIEQALIDERPVPDNIKQAYYAMSPDKPIAGTGGYQGTRYESSKTATIRDIRSLSQWTNEKLSGSNTLFQMADPVDTPAFKRWFGDSKVVDENGRPLVVYHGTDADFTEFLTSPTYGNAFFFLSTNKFVEGKKANVMEVYLKLENPFYISDSDELGITGAIERAQKQGYDGVIADWGDRKEYVVFNPEQIKSTANRGTFDPANPNILFQEADPRMPLGAYEESAAWLPQSEVMDEGWSTEVQPLLDKMQEAATQRLNNPQMEGAYKDLSPEGQQMLRQYLNGVTQDMASTKMAAQRWGAEKRDNTMLNYNKRYGFDKMLDVVFPYQFFYTRSMMAWAQRALDKPAWLSNYARLRKQQDRYENNLPERLRGKIRIDAPWLPDWMGDGLYIDPLSVLFTPHNFLRPFEQMAKDRNMQVIEAERILQEWAADGTVSQDEIVQAAQTRSGTTWERAIAEAQMRREAEISNPMDFVSTMFGPAWYLTTPAKLLGLSKDGPETISELPITRTARALDTVTNNTWAEPIGNVLGLLAKPEEAFREANNLPQMGEYGDYYTDRNIANMVAEGLITPEEASIAMIERQGEIFDAAVERTKMELAMRVPTAGFIYAALNEGVAAVAQAAVPSLFGAGLLPEGELKYRGMKDEWNEAWKLRDAGDTEAINRFFEKNPEYEAYLAKGKEPEERLRTFLIGQIWDGYMELGDTNRKQATAEMGDLFKQAFLNSETRAYDTLDIEQLTQWAQMLNQKVPNIPQTAPAIANPRQIDYYSKEVTDITDTFYRQRKRMYGDYYELEQGYYDLPKSERASYLVANPKLKQYWDWKDSYYERYPDLVPIFKGQVFKRVDTTNWPIGLTDYVEAYAFAGEQLPKGAYKALEQVWINEGRPMDDFDTWVKTQVLPAIQYQPGAQAQP